MITDYHQFIIVFETFWEIKWKVRQNDLCLATSIQYLGIIQVSVFVSLIFCFLLEYSSEHILVSQNQFFFMFLKYYFILPYCQKF